MVMAYCARSIRTLQAFIFNHLLDIWTTSNCPPGQSNPVNTQQAGHMSSEAYHQATTQSQQGHGRACAESQAIQAAGNPESSIDSFGTWELQILELAQYLHRDALHLHQPRATTHTAKPLPTAQPAERSKQSPTGIHVTTNEAYRSI